MTTVSKRTKGLVPCPSCGGNMRVGYSHSECGSCRAAVARLAMLARRKANSEAERAARIETIAYLKNELVLDARAYRSRQTYLPFSGAFAQRDLEILQAELERFDKWVAGDDVRRPHSRPYAGYYGRPES